ncbi:hypothetical protein ACFV1L_03285 [Kitasatospora sp. NPDC059646]
MAGVPRRRRDLTAQQQARAGGRARGVGSVEAVELARRERLDVS